MKSITLITRIRIVLTIIICCSGIAAHASHGTGGEITWRCNGNNEYIFQMKFYRDCNGISGPLSVTLSTTVPAVPTIPLSLISQTDISPDGFQSNGTSSCPNCTQGNGGNPIFGLLEEYVYESAPILLNGIPPVNGWEFSWGTCCRSNVLTNVSGAGSIGFLLKAKMFPYQNQDASTCFDASPYFAERPTAIICNGYPYTYHHLSFDRELDSLTYAFDTLYDDMGAIVPYAAGYSVNNPLSVPVTLDPNTGEMAFTAVSGGYYATVTKVTAFKCGIKVAEIRREINIAISNNCPDILTGSNTSPNLPPVITPPFQDSTGQYVSFSDTVLAGDTLSFYMAAVDIQLFLNGTPQGIKLNAYGIQYGDSCTSDSTGCLIPPCATLSTGSPYETYLGMNPVFTWRTTPAHLNYSFSCVQFSNTYHFLNKFSDNYCPANATNTKVISITVMPAIPRPPVINNNGTLECPWGAGNVYQWFLNRFAIPGATTSSYTPTQSGTYQVLAVEPSGQGNYSDEILFNPVGLNDVSQITEVTAKPNPSSSGIFELMVSSRVAGEITLRVTTITGTEIMRNVSLLAIGENRLALDLSGFSTGMYFVELKGASGIASIIKVVNQTPRN